MAGNHSIRSSRAVRLVGVVWALSVLLVETAPGARAEDRPTGRSFATRSVVMAPHAMAATSHPLATEIALDVMRQGGSAVDAAIAANAALGLMEPTGCGIGGDLFAIVWDAKTQNLYGLNASGRSPATLTLDEFRRRELDAIPALGPLPVSVPGCVDGWFELHGKFGRLPMDRLLAPTVAYARDGFPITPVIGDAWRRGAPKLKDQPGFAEIFLPGGEGPRDGQRFRNPALADTLERIGREGRDLFYRGEIARTIDSFMRANEGFLTYDDLAAHRSEWVEPISTDYRGLTLWELPPNGQGLAALQMLNLLGGFDLRKAGFGSPDHLHWFIEAKKIAFEDRARLYADPEFSAAPIDVLLSQAYADERRALIGDRAAASIEPKAELIDGDTIYLTVADAERNMVSLIQSNYRGFGSGMCPTGLGFCLQDRGQLFDLTEGRANTYAPRKRPFHTIIPAFVTRDGKPYIAFGVMGGATQPQAHVEILTNLVDFDMNLQEAGDAPRFIHTGSSEPTGERMTDGGRVHLEEGFSYETRRELLLRGHRLEETLGIYGGYQAILYDAENDIYHGASESRKDGMAAGY